MLFRSLLAQVIDDISERGDLSAFQSENDTHLFSGTMSMVETLDDIGLARKLDDALAVGDNRVFVAKRQARDTYYAGLLNILLSNLDLDLFMADFVALVPHMYSPNVSFHLKVLSTFEHDFPGRWHHFARLWSDLSVSRYCGQGPTGMCNAIDRFLEMALKAEAETDETAAAQAPT